MRQKENEEEKNEEDGPGSVGFDPKHINQGGGVVVDVGELHESCISNEFLGSAKAIIKVERITGRIILELEALLAPILESFLERSPQPPKQAPATLLAISIHPFETLQQTHLLKIQALDNSVQLVREKKKGGCLE
ncbi:hypothetical protein V8G54_031927 [Vigna mungo]|uniref:Uncharacterized protein n=1 Tax=Vigna mungo TaxID=3915 RepID=A0AAQ3ML28_VIGMU